jgi:hypothetical protein
MKLWQRRTIGILTLGGGVIGVVAAFTVLFTRSNPIEWIFCIAFAAIYAWGVLCGARLLEQQPGAERSTVKYWLLQIPSFSSPVFGYFLASGFHTTLSIEIDPLKANANFLFGSTFNYSLFQSEQPWLVGINIFAAGIAWWLARLVLKPVPL